MKKPSVRRARGLRWVLYSSRRVSVVDPQFLCWEIQQFIASVEAYQFTDNLC